MAAVATLQPQDDLPGVSVDLAMGATVEACNPPVPPAEDAASAPESAAPEIQTSKVEGQVAAVPVKPPQGEELWNCVKDWIVAEPWGVDSKDTQVPSSLIVFDWDDTLLPTTALVAAKRIAPAPGAPGATHAASQLSEWEFDDFLESCAKAAVEALRKASKYGRVVIITNSGFGWVHETASRFMPSVLSELEKIPVISARAIFECLGISEPYRWKVLCFRRIVDCFTFDPTGKTGPSSLISIGDGWQERLAAIMATQDTDLAMVKCLKFLEQPRVDQLVQQLDLCTQIFEGLAAHPGWIEASYSYTEEQGLQLEARAENTIALGGSFAASEVNGTVEVLNDAADDVFQDMEGVETEAAPEAPECSERPEEEIADNSEKTSPPSTGDLNGDVPIRPNRSLRRLRSKASLLARAGKMQALPLQQSYITMGGHKKVATRRRWFQARKKSVRTLKASNLVKCNGTAL